MIGNSSSEKSTSAVQWQPEDGWLGIMPGKTSIKDAINRLGGTCETSEMANGFSFDFQDGLIRVTTIEHQGTISKIWISGKLAETNLKGLIPANLKSATESFAGLSRMKSDSHNADIYEAPGVRLAIASGNDNGSLMWIEFIPL
ncbi:MAG: hypothetical protein JST89_26590 [Cyanobacteria bacterium SZAS-4]|nr:hypothetical protein [Cyanobacteria bacterium SZAS-4]